MARLAACGRNGPKRRWALNYRYPDDSSLDPLIYIYGPPQWTLDLSVTETEAQQVAASGRRYNCIRMNVSSVIMVNDVDVTENEAQRIRAGEDALDVILNRGYHLAVVPWSPS